MHVARIRSGYTDKQGKPQGPDTAGLTREACALDLRQFTT
jgi:hypothetical protein